MASILSSGYITRTTLLYKATSSDISFDNSYYFASSNTTASFNVNYWTGGQWIQKYTQTKTANFGHQIACTWDGDRFVVGSPNENKFYVYHSPGGSGSQLWTHDANGNLTSPTVYEILCPDSNITGRRFGWSVSISKDIGNHIMIGAPGDFTQSETDGQKRGKVYIYEWNGSAWTKTFDKTAAQAHSDVNNAGSSISISQPEIQLYASSVTSGQVFYKVNNASPQFGFYVDISGYAEYMAIGVPGTPIGLLNSTNLDGYSGSDFIDRTGGNSNYFENTAQLGCIVCYSTSNTNKSWASNTGLYGKPVRGQTEMSWTSGLSGETSKSNSSTTVIWDFTALGTTCKISLDGTRLIGGSPRYSFPGKQQSPNFGRLDAWNYGTTGSDWVLGKGRVVGSRPGNRLGMNIAIDYTGQRIVALLMIQPLVYNAGGHTGNGGIMVFDWNSNGFYEVTPEIQTNLGSAVDDDYGTVAISSGDIIAASAYNYGGTGRTSFYFYKLSGEFNGNQLIGGYLAADQILVGPNDGSTENTFKKQIKFGGTFFDNTYENTTIENRIYNFDQNGNDANQQGYSELIISKKTSADAPDMIRLKSNEFRIDTYVNQSQSNGYFTTIPDGEYDHHPALTMNIAGNFKLNAEFTLNSEDTQCEVKALLDVEGDLFGRRRINAGYLQGQKILGRKWPWLILYDTRSERTKNGNNLYSNTFCEFNAAGTYKHGRINSIGIGNNTITYHESEGAITLSGIGVHIKNQSGKTITGNGISGSVWIKLVNEHSTYSSAGVSIVSYGVPNATNHTGFRLQITNNTIRLNFGVGKIQPSSNYSLTKDKWYHIYYAFKPLAITTLSNTNLWINGVLINLTSSGTLTNASSYSSNHYIGSNFNDSNLNDSATNIYIGMVAHHNAHINYQFHSAGVDYVGQFPSAIEMYNWGQPQQKLAVGGDAFIENRLALGTTLPTRTLDVGGSYNISGGILVRNGESSGGATTPTTPQMAFGWNGSDTYQHFIRTRHNSAAITDNAIDFYVCNTTENNSLSSGVTHNLTLEAGNVGIGTSSPDYKLDVAVDINFTGTLYQNGVAFSGGGGSGSSVWSLNGTNAYYNNGNVGIGTSTPAYKLDIAGTTGGDALISSHIDNDIILFDDQKSTTTFTGTLYGGATRDTADNYIILASGVNSQNRTVSWPIHLPNYWTCEFDWLATTTGADETQFIFYATVPITSVIPVDTNASTASGFSVTFEFYEGDRIVIKNNLGTIVASSVVTFTSLSFYKVVITFNRGYLSVSLTLNTTILQLNHDFGEMSQAYTTGKYMGFGGRTGGVSSIQRVRNIKVTKGCPFVHQNNNLSYMNGNLGIGTTFPSYKLDVNGDINHTGAITNSSDDRLKENETRIENALNTICKLDPQTYDKRPDLESNVFTYEAGLIAQDIYYDVPELRYLVHVPSDATPSETKPESGSDIQVDPDYSDWGTTPASVNYIGLIPYLIKSIQELKDENDALKARVTALES